MRATVAPCLAAAIAVSCSLPRPKDVGTDSSLAALSASAGVLDPAFDPDVTEYDLDMVLAEDATTFSLTPTNPDTVSITLDGAPLAAGASPAALPMAPGSRDIDIVVTSNGGVSTSYRVHVHRGVDALSNLTPSVGQLSPAFTSAVTTYATGLHLDQAQVAVTPTTLIPSRATALVNGVPVASGAESESIALAPGSNPVDIVVTPKTRLPQTYSIAAGRGSDAAADIQLSLSGGAVPNRLTPAFDPLTGTYTAAVGLWVQHIQVSVRLLVPGSTVKVVGADVTPGTPSAVIRLNLGLTSIPVTVTAPDGVARTYNVSINRANSVAQSVYAKASNTSSSDLFGISVSLWGDTLVVGATGEASASTGVSGDQANNSASNAGAAYVFTRNSSGAWSQQAYLKASNTNLNDWFGWSVAVWGDTIAVGAILESSSATGVNGNEADNSASNAGAVYVFTRTGTTWSQQAYLKASHSRADAFFGSSISLWGDTLAVGSRDSSAATGVNGDEIDTSAQGSGAVHVFTRTGSVWSQQAYLKASNTAKSDSFGVSVALWEDRLAVGAPGEDSGATGDMGADQGDNSALDAGAVYTFRRTGSTWSQDDYLKAPNTGAGDRFGTSVSLFDGTMAVGAPFEDSAEKGTSGTGLDNSAMDSGATYVFEDSGHWALRAYLKAKNTDIADHFGENVAVWGDVVAVSADGEASGSPGVDGSALDNGSPGAGAIYVYNRCGIACGNPSLWVSSAYVKASNPNAGDAFGGVEPSRAIALWGDTLAVGAQNEASPATGIDGNQTLNTAVGAGAAYVFH